MNGHDATGPHDLAGRSRRRLLIPSAPVRWSWWARARSEPDQRLNHGEVAVKGGAARTGCRRARAATSCARRGWRARSSTPTSPPCWTSSLATRTLSGDGVPRAAASTGCCAKTTGPRSPVGTPWRLPALQAIHGGAHPPRPQARQRHGLGLEPRKSDFGLAGVPSRRPQRTDAHRGFDLTAAGRIVGTLSYMSPSGSAGSIDARSDLFSLGVLLTWRWPASTPSTAARRRRPWRRSPGLGSGPHAPSLGAQVPGQRGPEVARRTPRGVMQARRIVEM